MQGKYKKQSGGRGQYGDCWIEIEALPRGEGFHFYDKIVGGVIPKQYIPAVEKGIAEALHEGAIAGYPTVDFKVDLVDGSYHTVDSSEMAFKIAGSMAFKKGILEAKPTLLEPIMEMEITVPDDAMGDIIGDLNSRRGRVLGMETKGNKQIVKAQTPLSEVLKYAPGPSLDDCRPRDVHDEVLPLRGGPRTASGENNRAGQEGKGREGEIAQEVQSVSIRGFRNEKRI